MNPSPLPQPEARTCPNCGAALSENTTLCPNCGAALGTVKSSGCLMIGAQVFLGCLALVFGLAGACFAILGGTGFVGASSSEWLPFAGVVIVTIGLAAACVWGIIRLGKRRQ
ncbi:zinc-ribbon domain-containing protein [Abditibacterium utsteinense]|uniref:Zinc-ribbon domain-containing protein n=1 Tax=Abditibacterium utsteinense TaxID=1960156 RepID=A0A2S8SUP2_9BACT|nr:zinc-ribbon domain-containing protein [Abditibacterium utsteinense]PQV64515.1 zinc-ribbon domain-containing protein [Abditibacterium utsteinense]